MRYLIEPITNRDIFIVEATDANQAGGIAAHESGLDPDEFDVTAIADDVDPDVFALVAKERALGKLKERGRVLSLINEEITRCESVSAQCFVVGTLRRVFSAVDDNVQIYPLKRRIPPFEEGKQITGIKPQSDVPRPEVIYGKKYRV